VTFKPSQNLLMLYCLDVGNVIIKWKQVSKELIFFLSTLCWLSLNWPPCFFYVWQFKPRDKWWQLRDRFGSNLHSIMNISIFNTVQLYMFIQPYSINNFGQIINWLHIYSKWDYLLSLIVISSNLACRVHALFDQWSIIYCLVLIVFGHAWGCPSKLINWKN